MIGAAKHFFDEEVDAVVHKNCFGIWQATRWARGGRGARTARRGGALKRTHGSALFVRGNTQSLAISTLGPPSAEQLVETIEFSGKKRFMLHYNFPAYSVGETGPFRGPGRREIGHGALALKAIKNIIPSPQEFPYTIRVVSEVLSSKWIIFNGNRVCNNAFTYGCGRAYQKNGGRYCDGYDVGR